MNREKKKAFWIIIVIMALVGAIAGGGIYLFGEQVRLLGQGENTEIVKGLAKSLAFVQQDTFYYWAIPSTISLFLLLGLLIWAAVTRCLGRDSSGRENQGDGRHKGSLAKKDFIDHKIEQERKRRLFLHSLSILQREGRLLDFFDEDLSVYEDAQIGAAVRSIQEDCKKAVKKYIDPRPVLDGNEGDTVTIEDGFDIDAITLVGNVAGQPPFNGVIKHPGWKAGKKEVPKLSDIQDPSIMTPAEVEIQ